MPYLDNAATTFPKPEVVYETVDRFFRQTGANPGRSGHQMAMDAERAVERTRALIARFFNVPETKRVVFTFNATDGLNMVIKGLFNRGDHVVTTTMEHNSVLRPLRSLEREGVLEVTFVKASQGGVVAVEDILSAFRPNTRAVVMSHASNVCGAVEPAIEVAHEAHRRGVLMVLDAAQTAGVFPINMKRDEIDILVCPGHKALFGPPGTGIVALNEGVDLRPWREGGTGIKSEAKFHPEEYPFRLEGGTLNTVGIAGLGAGIEYIEAEGLGNIRKHEMALSGRLWDGLEAIRGVKMYGPADANERTGTLCFNLCGWDSSELAAVLDESFGIASRPGLHCAPLAHETLGTFPEGTLRLSLSSLNTEADVDAAIAAVREIASS